MPYIPQKGTLPERVCEFFRTNPTEELCSADIAAKFNVPTSSVSALLAAAVTNEALVRRADELGNKVYLAGPNVNATLPASQAEPATAPAPQAPAKRAKRISRGPLPLLDVDAIPVFRDLADPRSIASRRQRYFKLLDKLDAPRTGLEVPSQYRGALSKATQEYVALPEHKAKRFLFRTSEENPLTHFLVLRDA